MFSQMGCKMNNLEHTCLYDRVEKLLVSYEWSDCNFVVSGKHFKAHKLILGISSPVFEAMFYGPLASNCDIVITDIEPDTFQLLLNYIYTDKVELSSVEEAFELLYASRKYILGHLNDICISYIKNNISIDNVVTILNYPDYLQDQQILSYCLKLFYEHARYLLQEHKLLPLSCVKAILQSDNLNITEKDLIKYVFEWTKHYCKQNNIENTLEKRHNVLHENGLFKLLRFFTLSLDELDDILQDKNNLLSLDETNFIESVIISNDLDLKNAIVSLGTSICPRLPFNLNWHLCHRNRLKSVAPIVINSNFFIVTSRIRANKTIFIKTLCIPTRMSPVVNIHRDVPKTYCEELSVSIVNESNNSNIKCTSFKNTVEYDSSVDVELGEPCLLQKNEWYKISLIWPRQRYYSYSYVVESRDRFYNGHKILFEFDDVSSSELNGGSFIGGLKYCM